MIPENTTRFHFGGRPVSPGVMGIIHHYALNRVLIRGDHDKFEE